MRQERICVIGMGRVGLTLSLVLSAAGFKVLGVERNPEVLAALNRGAPHFYEKGMEVLLKEQLRRSLTIRGEIGGDSHDAFVVCIATPVDRQTHRPVLTDLLRGVREMAPYLREGNLIIMRSTVPVGTTRHQVLPLIKQYVGTCYLAFCPERTIEGRALEELRQLPQIIGALDEESEERAVEIFSKVTPTTIRVSSLEAAEMIKLIDNSFRDMNFAYANEIALIAENMGLDAAELVKAANLGYPRNKVPVPGPVGGTCLSKDPYILLASAGERRNPRSLIGLAREVNESIPGRIAHRAAEALEAAGKDITRAKVFIVGIAFKGQPETDDLRDSPAFFLWALLRQEFHCSHVFAHDFVVSAETMAKAGLAACSLEEGFKDADCVIFMNNHRFYYELDIFRLTSLMNKPAVLMDGWHIFDPKDISALPGITYGGLGVG